ncbi:MAG: 2-succinyl-5-enolpyruvyl-6-hydroxy-3-cyclohexene-1-carboxylic-acid synthase [Spirosomataceae bacterium]
MAILQPIHDIAEICAQKNITDVILCPGSRSAALTISFARHPSITTYSIPDERSAGFIGMGMALQSGRTVAIVCTSGSAAYNFAPAVVEAYFQEIPLLILTADRPSEWINQYDGQTIYQREIYGKHVKKSFDLPVEYSNSDAVWQIERVANEAINLSQAEPKGPVHINVPIREPFYPNGTEKISFNRDVRIINQFKSEKVISKSDWNEILDIWESSDKKLIAVGQNNLNLSEILSKISTEFSVPVLGDVISNLHRNAEFISSQDIFLSSNLNPELRPDLLITCGKSFISKSFKQFIRANKPKFHIHIQENSDVIDPFQSLTHKLEISPNYFFEKLFSDLDFQKFREGDEEDDDFYIAQWRDLDVKAKSKLYKYLDGVPFSEFKVVEEVLQTLPDDSILHLGNSMPVRYANIIGTSPNSEIEVYCNRGTSGIDGILSTAVGQALKTDKTVVCLIGDVSFFYDRNALWNNYLPKNLRVIVLNNQGGNIFRIIDGPSRQPELEEFFVTKQNYSAQKTAEDAGIDYYYSENEIQLKDILSYFYLETNRCKLLEIKIDAEISTEVFKNYKKI